MAGQMYLAMIQVPFISVHLQGIPGAGKSLVLDYLSYKTNVQCFPEPVAQWSAVPVRAADDQLEFINLLAEYYRTGQYGFELQSLVRRTFYDICNQPCYKSVRVIERSIHAARAFYESASMTPLQVSIEESWQKTMQFDPRFREDLILYLRCEPEEALNRIQIRGRPGESANLTLALLEKMERRHDEWLTNLAHVTIINTNGPKNAVIRNVAAAFDQVTQGLGNLPPPTDPLSPHVPVKRGTNEGPELRVQRRVGEGQTRQPFLSGLLQSLLSGIAAILPSPIPSLAMMPLVSPKQADGPAEEMDQGSSPPPPDPWSAIGVLTQAQQWELQDALLIRQVEPTWSRVVTVIDCGSQVSVYPDLRLPCDQSAIYVIPKFVCALATSRFTQFPNADINADLIILRKEITAVTTQKLTRTDIPLAELFDWTLPRTAQKLTPLHRD